MSLPRIGFVFGPELDKKQKNIREVSLVSFKCHQGMPSLSYPIYALSGDNRVCYIKTWIIMYKEEQRGRCLECGDVLPYGRSDMKFCCVNCKSRYHYVNGGHHKSIRLKTISALDRNHAILMSLIEDGVTSINIPDLAQMGYRFDCVSSYHKVRNHNEFRCYDLKYYKTDSRIFGLSRVEVGPTVKKR